MANKNTVKLTEKKLREMVMEAVNTALNENFFDGVGQKVKDFGQKAKDKFYDFQSGYDTKEGNPQSIEDLFAGDGYRVLKSFNKNGATYYAVVRKTGAFAEFFGPEGNDMAEELNIYLDGNGTATYVGYHPKVKGAELFKIEF